MPAGHLHRRLMGGGLPAILAYLQSLDPQAHIYPLSDANLGASGAPYDELGDVTKSDNTIDGRVRGVDAGVLEQQAEALGVYGHPYSVNFNGGTSIEMGGYSAGAVAGRTFGCFARWKRGTNRNPSTAQDEELAIYNVTDAGYFMQLRCGTTTGPTYNDTTKTYHRLPRAVTNTVPDTWSTGRLYTWVSEDKGSGNYQHRFFCNNSKTDILNDTNAGLCADKSFKIILDCNGITNENMLVAYVFHLPSYALSLSEVAILVDRYAL